MKPSTKKRLKKEYGPSVLMLLSIILMLAVPAFILYAVFKSELVMGCYTIGVLVGALWVMLLNYMDKKGWMKHE